MTPEQESEMLITSESKSRTKYKKRCLVLKQQQQQQQVNSAKYMTTMHAHDTNYPITQPIDKHDTYTVPLELKLGLVVTNHIREFYAFDYHYYYYYYYYH